MLTQEFLTDSQPIGALLGFKATSPSTVALLDPTGTNFLPSFYWASGNPLVIYPSPSTHFRLPDSELPEVLKMLVPSYAVSMSLESHTRRVNELAEAYSREAILYSEADLDALYDDAYVEAMELQKKLP